MTFAIEQARLVMLGGRLPDVTGLCIATLATYALAAAALKFFFRARGEFADAV
jgi:ABC-type polysaccharide/polyol phosphate export permease